MLNEAQIERLILISKEKPLLPELFIPWKAEIEPNQVYMPEHLISLYDTDQYHKLTSSQKIELGRHEMVQVLYSYAWTEGLFCLFMNKVILDLNPEKVEYRFLLRELIEEFRHQDMFACSIKKIDGQPIPPAFFHDFLGKITAKYLPKPWVFISCLAIELITDVYGKYTRKDENTFIVMRKVGELHHIEEGRHILFAENWLKKYTQNAGFIKRSWYSILVLINIYYLQTLYVKKEIFVRIGVENPEEYYKIARKNFKINFAKNSIDTTKEFVERINGFNWLTKPLWRRALKMSI